MPTCHKCGKEATILYKDKWWCLDHFKLEKKTRESGENAVERNIQKLPGYRGEHHQTEIGKDRLEQVFDETGIKVID